jgi:predicted  nucleic acid-binding Zn-ribbon protein
MPLIALDILEARIKELLIMVGHLNEENAQLKERSKSAPASSANMTSADPTTKDAGIDLKNEIESLKRTVIKYKNDRNQVYTRLAAALRQIDELTNKG